MNAMQKHLFALVVLSALALASVGATSDGSKVADAAMNGDRATVRALVTGGEDVNAAQGDGTPMANAMLTLLQGLGFTDLKSFGDSTGTLDLNAVPTTL